MKRQSYSAFNLSLILAAAGLPVVLASASQGQILFVSNNYNPDKGQQGTIERFDLATNQDLGTFASFGNSSPQGLAFDSAGNLFVADFYNNQIDEFANTGGGVLSTTPTVLGSGLTAPEGLAFDSQGDLFVANVGSGIQEFAYSGGSLSHTGTTFADSSNGVQNPAGLAFDSAGNLYVANSDNNTIEKFPLVGGSLSTAGSTFITGSNGFPAGIEFDSANDLYVSNFGNSSIDEYSPTGTFLASLPNSNAIAAQDTVMDAAGDIYAPNYFGSIEEYSPAGVDEGPIATVDTTPTFAAIQFVPEPASMSVLMVACMATLRRRRV